MLVSLCPALATTASADAQVTTVTLNSGDTVLKLCQNIGVDFYAHKNLIMSLNGFTSEAQFSKMGVGTKIVLPVSNAAAANLSKSGVGAATTTTTPVASTVTGTPSLVTGTTTSIPTGDYASYYLVNYTVQPGETISGIYNNWGLSYKTYVNQIVKLNRLGSINSIQANRTYVLPTTNPAIAGSAYTTVMAHVMRAGDSAYNIICTDYGLNYNSVQAQVQALNNRENLGNFMVGEVLYIPVTGLVSSNTTVTPGTGSSSSSAIINGSAAYNLVSQTPSNGNFALVVDGNVANAAVAGKTVEIVATPNTGYAVSSISVTKVGDPNTSVTVQGNKFIMPAYSVSVSVSFSQAVVSNIKVDATVNGSVSAMVNSAVVSSATAGNVVTVKTIPATGFMLDTIRVTYNDYRDTVAVENGQFVMPTFPVTVSASFKVDPSFDPTKGHNIYVDAANAKVITKIGDTEVATAKAGDRVTLSITPDTNYTVQNLVVYYDNFNKTVDVEKNTFTMPDGPVTIVATVKPTANAVFGITKVVNKDGNVSVTVNGQEASSANVGATVKITGSSSKAYFNYIPTVFKTGDTSTTVPVAADGTFTMPDFPVTVSVKFYIYRNIYLDASNGTNGWFNVTAAANGMAVSKAGAGVELKVTVWGFNKNTHAPGDVIVTYADGSVHTLTGATFIMPDCDIKVRVNFNPVQRIAAYSAVSYKADGTTKAGRAYNSYTVGGLTIDDNGSYLKATLAGEKNTVIVTPSPALGYKLKDIKYSYYDASGVHHADIPVNYNSSTGRYQFEMPKLKSGTSLELRVSFIEIKSCDITLDYDASLGQVTAITSIGIVTSAAENSKVTLLFAPKSGYSVDYASIEVIRNSDNSPVYYNKNDNSFFMPAEDVTVKVNFKTDLNKIFVNNFDYSADLLTQRGLINVLVNGIKYTESQLTHEYALPDLVKAGSIVTIINESRNGYILNAETPISITSPDGSIAYETVDRDKFTFVMPNADVTITPIYTEDMYNIVTVATDKGIFELPKQASYIEPVFFGSIVPNPGYEVDKVLVTYTDHDGIQHRNEEIDPAAGFMPAGSGIPLSDVVFEVVFKPVLNPISIDYIYNSKKNDTRNYAVDLFIDGVLVEGFTRDPAGELDTLAIDKDKNQGLPTGATVVIKRQEFNQDVNFSIKNMWITHGTNAIQPEYANNQYYFTVPYVDSKDPDDLVLNVQYGTDNDQNFRVDIKKAETSVGSATAEFSVNGTTGMIAQPNDDITITLTAEAGYILASPVKVVYQNSDGNEVKVDPSSYDAITGEVKFSIPTLPKNGVAYVEYTTAPVSYPLTYDATESGGGICSFYADPNGSTISAAPYGSTVIAKPERTGFSATEVKAVCGGEVTLATDNGDGTWSFVMPCGEAKVIVTYSASSYTLTSKNIGNGSGTIQYKVGETVYNDGDAIPCGSSVTVVAACADGSSFGGINFGGSDIAADANGNFVITMPAANSEVLVNFQAKGYNLNHTLAVESVQPVTYTINGSTNNPLVITASNEIVIAPAAADHALVKAIVSYVSVNGDVNSELVPTKLESGAYSVQLPAVPQDGAEVYMQLVFSAVAVEYELINVHSGEEELAELKFYSSDNKETRGEPITKALNGSTVYGELKVRYNKAVKDNKIFWAGGASKAELELDRVSDDGMSAYFKFDFEMPKANVNMDYVLENATLNVSIDSSRGAIQNSIALGNNIAVNINTDPIPAETPVVYLYATYVNEDGQPVRVDAQGSSTPNQGIITLPSALPRHDAASDRLNMVTIHIDYSAY